MVLHAPIPNDYTPLNACYFNLNGIPPPLVDTNWICQINDHCTRLMNETKIPTLASEDVAKLALRKRGRPKKLAQNVLTTAADELFSKTADNDCIIKEEKELNNVLLHDEYITETFSTEKSRLDDIDSAKEGYKNIDGNTENIDMTIAPLTMEDKLKSKRSELRASYFFCNQCPKRFRAESTLKSHMRHHSGDLYKCNECDRGFERKYQLKSHQRIHTGTLLQCELCRKGFTTAELLKVHIRRHTGEKPFVCEKCTMSFPTVSNLNQHKVTHMISKNFLCAHCGQAFIQKRSLLCHMLVHGEKRHVCHICQKRWARKGDLLEHIRVHTKSRPFICSLCNKAFSQSSTLRRHSIIHQYTDNKHK